jgi:hypothetical protein
MKPGDIVMLKDDSFYYYQAPGVVGVFLHANTIDENWIFVRWSQTQATGRPSEDHYPLSDLTPAHKLARLLMGVQDVE